jgi:hypothetical protein
MRAASFVLTLLALFLGACAPCRSFRYSNCPDRCERRCVSSGCGQDVSGETLCTGDCEGANSCVSPDDAPPATPSAAQRQAPPQSTAAPAAVDVAETDLAEVSPLSEVGQPSQPVDLLDPAHVASVMRDLRCGSTPLDIAIDRELPEAIVTEIAAQYARLAALVVDPGLPASVADLFEKRSRARVPADMRELPRRDGAGGDALRSLPGGRVPVACRVFPRARARGRGRRMR